MKLTDIFLMMLIFGLIMVGGSLYIGSLATNYPAAAGYGSTYNTNAYETQIGNAYTTGNNTIGTVSNPDTAQSNPNILDPYKNVFLEGYNSVRQLLGLQGSVSNVTSTATGPISSVLIPRIFLETLAAAILIIIIGAIIYLLLGRPA